MAHADEVDDIHCDIPLHPGCAAVPAALAVGERQKASGKALINAVVLGYDIAGRVSSALNQSELQKRKRGSMGISTCFGSAAASSNLLGLSKEQVSSALGLAGEQACGTTAIFNEPTHMAKAFSEGVEARNGVTAALLAQVGFQGVPDIFEGSSNVLDAFSGEGNSPGQLIKDLGKYYYIIDGFIKNIREADLLKRLWKVCLKL